MALAGELVMEEWVEKPGSHPDLGDFDLDHHRHHHRHHHHHGLHHDDQEGNPSTRSHSCLGDMEKNRYNKDLLNISLNVLVLAS